MFRPTPILDALYLNSRITYCNYLPQPISLTPALPVRILRTHHELSYSQRQVPKESPLPYD